MNTPATATSTRKKATTPTGSTQAGMPPSSTEGTTGTLGIGVAVGPAVGLGVGVSVGVADGTDVGVAVGSGGTGVAVAVGVAVGTGVGVAVGSGAGAAVGVDVGAGAVVGVGVGTMGPGPAGAVGVGAGAAVGVAVGSAVGVGVGVTTPTVISDTPPIGWSFRLSSLNVPANRYVPSDVGAVTVYITELSPSRVKLTSCPLATASEWVLDTKMNPAGSVSMRAPKAP